MYKNNSSINSYLVDNTAWDTTLEWFSIEGKNREYITNSMNNGNYRNTELQHKGGYVQHLWFRSVDYESVFLVGKSYKSGSINFKNVEMKPNEVSKGEFRAYEFTGSETIYTRLEVPTGSNDNFKVKNVYDMAGNLAEWTGEFMRDSDDKVFTSRRGGNFRS